MKDIAIIDGPTPPEPDKPAAKPDPIEAAVEAYRNRTPDSIKVFRALTDEQADVVVRVLKMTARGPKAKKGDGK